MLPRPHRRAGIMVGAAFALGAMIGLIACGSSDRAQNATPGYDDTPRTIDTTPFVAPGLGASDGPTTIPDSYFESGPGATSTTVPATAIPPPTTTTTALGPLVAPVVASIKDLCGFEETIGPYERLPEKSPADVETLASLVVAASQRYADVAPAELQADAQALATKFAEIRDVLADNGWNARSDAYSRLVDQFRVEAVSRKPGSFPVLLTTMVVAEHERCG